MLDVAHLRRLLTITLLTSAVLVPAAPAEAQSAPRTLIITDSTGAAIRWEAERGVPTLEEFAPLAERGGSWEFRGESCRSVSLPSCHGRDGYRPLNVLEELATVGPGRFDELVLMVGYNEGIHRTGAIDAVLTSARTLGFRHVTWLDFCVCSSYVGPASLFNGPDTYGERNATLRAAADRSDGLLSVLDWGSVNQADPGLTLDDRTHLTQAGAVRVARLMAEAVATAWGGWSSRQTTDVAEPQLPDQGGYFSGLQPPVRLLDTRSGAGRLRAGESIKITLDPALTSGAVGVVVNLTTTEQATAGYLTVYPCTAAVPLASVSNYDERSEVANATVVKLSATGSFCIYTMQNAHLVVDLTGVLYADPARGDGFTALPTPTRIFDSRLAGARLTPEHPIAVSVFGRAIHANVTVTEGDGIGYVTVWPADADRQCSSRPTSSTSNWTSEIPVANRLDLAAPTGAVCVFVSQPAHVVIDQAGVYEAGGSPIELSLPRRLLDSRVHDASTDFSVATPGTTLLTASVVALPSKETSLGFVSVWSAETCSTPPVASVVNHQPDRPAANSVVLINRGRLCIHSNVPGHVVVDVG